MSMLKRAKGNIEKTIEGTTEATSNDLEDLGLHWNTLNIKDVLDVPTVSPAVIDVNLDEDDGDDIIAIRA